MNDPSLNAVLLPAGVALATTLLTTAAGWWWSTRQRRRTDEAQLLADAYAAVLAYREFAFSVRRRDAANPAEERVRLSEQMRTVQERIDHHRGWMRASIRREGLATAYDQLVGETRQIVGASVRAAWNDLPITSDPDMNMPHVAADLAALSHPTDAFLAAVRRHRYPLRTRVAGARTYI